MKKLIPIFLVLVLSIALFASVPTPVSAQSSPTPTPQPMLLSVEDGVFTFAQLEAREVTLFGPDDSYTLLFGLPANWELTGGAELKLIMSTSFYTYADRVSVSPEILGGFLTVRLNRTLLGVLPLNEVGDVERSLPIPVESLQTFRSDGQMELEISLNSGLSCLIDQQMNVMIQPSSRISLPHEEVLPNTDLVTFPRPLYQASVFPDEALLVIPDQPTAAELQSAFTVSAGLGNLSNGNLALDMTTASALTVSQLSATHLIFVGQSASLPILGELPSPLALSGGSYPVDATTPDTGVVQMVNSPWNEAKAILVVSGNSDAAIVKAAQAVSTGLLRPNYAPNLALIEEVQDVIVPSSQPVDQTLADMGYEDILFEGKGFDSESYTFYVPHGKIISSDAYFELVYGHSALLDYDRSGVVVLVNGQPIGSVRVEDATAEIAANRKIIEIPPALLVPGNNVLEIEFNLQPIDPCAVPNLRALWINVWNESLIHLPMGENLFETPNLLSLNMYPAPFTLDAVLETTALVVQRDSLTSWLGAMQIANFLGESANGPLTTLSVFYADDFPEAERENYHILAVGLPSQLPLLGEMNSTLPAPFEANSDIALESNMQVTFQIPAEVPLGYVELLASPWNNERVVIAALGNSPEGLNWAIDALVDRTLRKDLSGNFAVVDTQRILTTDTRLMGISDSRTTPPEDTPAETTDITPPDIQQLALDADNQNWLPLALALSGAFTLLILVTVLFVGWAKDRKRTRIDRGGVFIVAVKEWFSGLRGGSNKD